MDKEKELTGSAGSIVYAWDVVNEYLHRQSFARTWTNIYKNSGMLKAYNVQDKVTLFYNDYNTYFGIQKTLNLVEFINAAKSMG